MSLYDRDFHAWAEEQAALLRERRLDGLDWVNLAEELGDLSTLQRTHLRRLFVALTAQLLRWQLQPNLQSHEWRCLIGRLRDDVDQHLEENASLAAKQGDVFARAYKSARLTALSHTGLPEESVPRAAPFSLEQARDDAFWPQAEP